MVAEPIPMVVKPRQKHLLPRRVWWSVEPVWPADIHSQCVSSAYVHAPGADVEELPAKLEVVAPVWPAAKRVRRVVYGDVTKLLMQLRLVMHTIDMLLARHCSTFARKTILLFLMPLPMANRADGYQLLPLLRL